jgi:hypothetical protein
MLERKIIRAEFASKGVAGSGLGLGIAGTALGLLNNGGNGLLGGLLGGGNQNVVSALQADTLIGKYLPMLKQVGIVDENNKVDIEVAKGFINSAFDKSGAVEYLGFKFDKSDGEALINIMEKYKDD